MGVASQVDGTTWGIPDWAVPLYQPRRWKVLYGGRWGAKTWSFSQALVVQAHSETHRIYCGREHQKSIHDSVKPAIEG